MQGATEVMSGVLIWRSIHLVLIVPVVMMHRGGRRLHALILRTPAAA
jgi:hypothetical protein